MSTDARPLVSRLGSPIASREALERTAAPFGAIGSRWLLAPLVPVVATLLVITAAYVAGGGSAPDLPPRFATLVYGVANVALLGALYVRWDGAVWRASALFRRPSGTELAAAVAATALGVVACWPATTLLADALGVARYAPGPLSSPAGLVALFVGSVLVAPVAEELLFRGLFVGVVLQRGGGPLAAAASSLLVFAAIHVFTAGVAGVANALLLGALLTWLRFRFDNLAGAWLLHALNNLLEFLVALSVLPSLYAL
jgi:hypothetical protein